MNKTEAKLAVLCVDVRKLMKPIPKEKPPTKTPFNKVTKEGKIQKVTFTKHGTKHVAPISKKPDPIADDAESAISGMMKHVMPYAGKSSRDARVLHTVVHTYKGSAPLTDVVEHLRKADFKSMSTAPEKGGLDTDAPYDLRRFNSDKIKEPHEVHVKSREVKLKKPVPNGPKTVHQVYSVQYHKRNAVDTEAPKTAASHAEIIAKLPAHLHALHKMISEGKTERAAAKVKELVSMVRPAKAKPANKSAKIMIKASSSADALHAKLVNVYERHYKTKAKIDECYEPKRVATRRNYSLFLSPTEKNDKTKHIPDVGVVHNNTDFFDMSAMTGEAPNHTSGLQGREEKKPVAYFKQLLKSHDAQYARNKARGAKK